MGRGKVEMKRIENPITRQVTFGKRKIGLFKKAKEISVMCDSEVALILFSTKGKLFQFSTDSRMEQILERHETYSYADGQSASESQENWSLEYTKLLSKVQLLQNELRHLVGENLDSLRLREIQRLEKQLDQSLKRIRGRKNHMMNESISELQTKEKTLSERNRMLAKKAKDNTKSPTDHCMQQDFGQSLSSNFVLPPPTLTMGREREREKEINISEEDGGVQSGDGSSDSADPITTGKTDNSTFHPWMGQQQQQ